MHDIQTSCPLSPALSPFLYYTIQGVIQGGRGISPPFNYDWVSIAGYWNNSWPFFSNIFWLLFSFPPSTSKSCMTPCYTVRLSLYSPQSIMISLFYTAHIAPWVAVRELGEVTSWRGGGCSRETSSPAGGVQHVTPRHSHQPLRCECLLM